MLNQLTQALWNQPEKFATKLQEAGYQVHFQHHPNIRKDQPLTTAEAVAIADCIVCYDSTVGFEALFAGKKVVYLQTQLAPLNHA